MTTRPRLAEALIAGLCILAGMLFFADLGRLWPLVDADLVGAAFDREDRAREFLAGRGFDLAGYRSAGAVTVDARALDYVEPAFGRERVQAWVRDGLPLAWHRVWFKHRGERTSYTLDLHPAHGVIGWWKQLEEDAPGPSLELEAARELARSAMADGLRLDPARYEERSAATTERLARRDHTFLYETLHSEEPELRERVTLTVAGGEVAVAWRELRVPPAAARAERAAEAPSRALETFGFILLAAGTIAAFFVFLDRLRAGAVLLRRATIWPLAIFAGLLATYGLETSNLFRYWEPLWPRWVSAFEYLSQRGLEGALLALLLLVFVAAGDALDRASGAGRGTSLWSLARGRFDSRVALASGRGFLIGLLCGGTLAGAVRVLAAAAGAETALQPRGFFFYTLNTAAPALVSLFFFLAIALAEELGYRFFGGTWLLARTGRRWVAVWLPALIYGLTHTRLDFLPPAEPWWARALVLTLVGAVWGWAFLRYDALTVVLSHFTADLFIFNWPRLASGDTGVVAVSLLTVSLPLLPALAWLVLRRRGATRAG